MIWSAVSWVWALPTPPPPPPAPPPEPVELPKWLETLIHILPYPIVAAIFSLPAMLMLLALLVILMVTVSAPFVATFPGFWLIEIGGRMQGRTPSYDLPGGKLLAALVLLFAGATAAMSREPDREKIREMAGELVENVRDEAIDKAKAALFGKPGGDAEGLPGPGGADPDIDIDPF